MLLLSTLPFKNYILGNEINSERTRPRRSTGCSVAVVIVGGYDRVGGYSLQYVDAFDPVTDQWSSLAKLPPFTKSEYAVATFRNSILLSGGKMHSKDVWQYQVKTNTNSNRFSTEDFMINRKPMAQPVIIRLIKKRCLPMMLRAGSVGPYIFALLSLGFIGY